MAICSAERPGARSSHKYETPGEAALREMRLLC
jgi:hypothetical protein